MTPLPRSLLLGLCWLSQAAAFDDDLATQFRDPPDSARPGVYWYFMDGHLSREGMTRDLESMAAAGLGHLIFLEVNVGVPRGPVGFLSDRWQELFVHAVREAERLGLEITLGVGPGWTGSGGPWVKPEQSMRHLVAGKVQVQGPGAFDQVLPVPPPRRPFFGEVPIQMRAQWESYFQDVAVMAFPTPRVSGGIPDLDEKALVYRAPYSSQPGVKPHLETPADVPTAPEDSAIDPDRILDLTARLRSDGSLDWQIPAGNWTVLRWVSRSNGASTRPAPAPGIGFESDKFDTAALDAHFEAYVGRLLQRVGARPPGRGWTMLHMDSWEMGAQNWTTCWREEFQTRRGYDPQPYYPVLEGYDVGSRERSERFLWDLRYTAQELVIEHHAEHLKKLAGQYGLGLSIEPYDMNPVNDFDLGAVADVPMCEFWSIGFNTTYSCQEAASIAHVLGRPVVAAEAFTGAPGEDWKLYPGALKNQGDWAFGSGINRFTYHTFAHKPDEGRPGMAMGPYGVHWDRGQTWWSLVAPYHRYIARCQQVLRQGRTVADILYLMPEGAPNVFQPPPSAFSGSPDLPDRRGYNFDGCSAQTLLRLAAVRAGRIVFPSGASYRVLVLPRVRAMRPQLLDKLEALIRAGATVVGDPPQQSPSLVGYPECDEGIALKARSLWGGLQPPAETIARVCGQGRLLWGGVLSSTAAGPVPLISKANWIWYPQDEPAQAAPIGSVWFRREFVVTDHRQLAAARLETTADNSFTASLNGTPASEGADFHRVVGLAVSSAVRTGTNVLTIRGENDGASPNPAGLLAALRLDYVDGSQELIVTDGRWTASTNLGSAEAWRSAKVLGAASMEPWNLDIKPPAPALYPSYDAVAQILDGLDAVPDFECSGPVRYTHRSTEDREIYFLANRSDRPVQVTATFRVAQGAPEYWDPVTGRIRALPEFTRTGQRTSIPLEFDAYESGFVVFPTQHRAVTPLQSPALANRIPVVPVGALEGAWDVEFESGKGAPAAVRFETLEDWTLRPEPGIRHYSGLATYRKTFDLPSSVRVNPGTPLYLDLGDVRVMARVRLNGRDCGVVWTAPWRVDIAEAVQAEANALEIDVANLWPNRMIGDAGSTQAPYTSTTYRPYRATDPLLPSGLIGPVTLESTSVP